MPTSLTIPLAIRGQQLPENATPALHATFFQWLERGDAEIARQVHAVSDPKPYTISPLVRDGDAAHFRITLLDDALWSPLKVGIESKPEVRVLWATLPLADEPRVESRSYTTLAHNAREESTITLQFDSPTSFKSREMHYPLPDPVLVFASYHARWNAFAPAELQIDAAWDEWVRDSVAVSRFELKTEVVRHKEFSQIGFVGVVQYSVAGKHADVRAGIGPLNALADYAFFCGTGHKTTQGMGQTRRVVG
jgi:CRISPR-associated endoribonuclease Cas6